MKRLVAASMIFTVGLLASCTTTSSKPSLVSMKKAAAYNAQLGAGYLGQDKLEQAKIKLEKALEQDPDNALAHGTYALLQARLREPKIAEQYFQKAIGLNPEDSELLNNYGTFLCDQGKAKDADKRFLEAASNPLYRTPEFAYTNAGRCAQQAGNLAQAEQHYRSAIQANPRFSPALVRLAEINYAQHRYQLARNYIERYHKVGPQSAGSLGLAVKIYRRLGDKGAAGSYALKLKGRYPDSKETKELLKSQ